MAKQTETRGRGKEIAGEWLERRIAEHVHSRRRRLAKYWSYYRNAKGDPDGQRSGLPSRLLEVNSEGGSHEVVIENDIAWRIHAMVDFMLSQPVTIQSLAGEKDREAKIEAFLREVLEKNGGLGFLQDMALLGGIYGFSDVLVRVNDDKQIVLEIVDPQHVIPVLHQTDYRRVVGYVIHWRQKGAPATIGRFAKLSRRLFGQGSWNAGVTHTHVWTNESLHVYEQHGQGSERELVSDEVNRLGRIPVVHIQNVSQPFYYEGLGEVEPLMALQDELNTRLSDRANRVTFQSFKMYLGKGIDDFIERPVGPGQMWSTSNPDAEVITFGGDGKTPSEETHISEVREAMDKASGVSPLVTGSVNGRIGNLTSENALRIVMLGLINKTSKKRVTYGEGLEQICELILHAANVYGIFKNDPKERRVRLDWADPMLVGESQQLKNAKMKRDLGVPESQVLTELGYAEADIKTTTE